MVICGAIACSFESICDRPRLALCGCFKDPDSSSSYLIRSHDRNVWKGELWHVYGYFSNSMMNLILELFIIWSWKQILGVIPNKSLRVSIGVHQMGVLKILDKQKIFNILWLFCCQHSCHSPSLSKQCRSWGEGNRISWWKSLPTIITKSYNSTYRSTSQIFQTWAAPLMSLGNPSIRALFMTTSLLPVAPGGSGGALFNVGSDVDLVPTAITCGHPGNPAHGLTNGTEFNLNDLVNFTCHTGYRLQGASRAQCRSNGQWSSPLPICRGRRGVGREYFTLRYRQSVLQTTGFQIIAHRHRSH